LDMIWLDQDGEIVHLAENVLPEPDTPDTELTQYRPPVPARYVIELAAGQIKTLDLKVGDKINYHG